MATLEDAAEQLVVKLKGLDSEIEESQHALEDLHGRLGTASAEVDEEWSHLTKAVSSLLETVREGQERLATDTQESLQATAEACAAVAETGAGSRAEIVEARPTLEALTQHAAGLQPGIESLIEQAGEAPAHALAKRAQEIEHELAQVMEEASNFLEGDAADALEQLATDVRQRSQAMSAFFIEQGAAMLEAAFEEWESKVDGLEEHVSSQGFLASHGHARAVVAWALEECHQACEAQLESLQAVVAEAVDPLQALGAAAERQIAALAGSTGALMAELADTLQSAAGAVSALDEVKELLASYTFVEV